MTTPQGLPFTIDDLRRWVLAFRRACERAAASLNGSDDNLFWKFPRGQCWNASHWLADFLHNHCGVPAGMITVCTNGLRSDGSHAWLRVGDWIVDITHDQFADAKGIDFVTSDEAWHLSFDGSECREYRPPDENDALLRDSFETYNLILSHLHPPDLAPPYVQ